MKVLAIEKEIPGQAADAIKPLLKAEAAVVWRLYQAGAIRETYFHADQHSAVLVLECEDGDSARQVLNQLPLVQAGLIDFEILPLIPYPGYERLFEESSQD